MPLSAPVAALVVALAATAYGQTIQARKADDVVESMGINVHMEYTGTAYGKYDLVNSRLQELGMRHIRDEINHADPAVDPSYKDFIAELQEIGNLGYTLCGLIEGGNDYPPSGRLQPARVSSMIQSLAPAIEVVEGPNEPDDGGFVYNQTIYPLGAIDESEDLWSIVKGSPAIKTLPVLAMSEGTPQNFTNLENLVKLKTIPPASDYTSAGNMHAYQGGGVGNSGLDQYIQLSREWTGNEPLWTTEMGYHNNTSFLVDPEQQGVSERASAIYLPIAFLSGFHRGVVQTFSYELIDEGSEPPPHCSGKMSCSGEGYYGLLNNDESLTPKPAFTALRNLIELLQEPGSNFQPGSLAVTISGAPKTMQYTLLQKSNGDYYLALWNDVSVYQVAACAPACTDGAASEADDFDNHPKSSETCTKFTPGKDLYPPDVPIALTFRTPQAFTVYAPNDASGAHPTDAYTISITSTSIKLKLPAKVLLIKIVAQS